MKIKKMGFILFITMILFITACSNEINNINDENNMDVNQSETKEDTFVRASEVVISKKDNMTVESFYADKELIDIAMKYIGKDYGDLKYLDYEGNEYQLSDIDKPIILMYTSPYCGACIMTIETMNQAKEKYPEYEVISMMDRRDLNAYNIYKEKGHKGDLYYMADDEDLKKAEFNSQGIPFLIFMDENKEIRLVHLGSLELDMMMDGLVHFAFKAER